jgi:hypothetical protein
VGHGHIASGCRGSNKQNKKIKTKKKKKRLHGIDPDSSRPSFCGSPKIIAKKVSTRKI